MTGKDVKIEVKQGDITNVQVVCKEPIKTIFADGLAGIGLVNNSVRMNFFEDKYNPATNELKRYIISRVSLNLDIFYSFVDILKQVKEDIESGTLVTKIEQDKGGKDGQ